MRSCKMWRRVGSALGVAVSLAGCAAAVREPDHADAYGLRAPENGTIQTHVEPGDAMTADARALDVRDIPALPEALANPAPLTLTAEVTLLRDGREAHFVREIVRTASRVHVLYRHQGQEWLFLRNPVDPRRVDGRLVDHREHAILTYYEGDLADTGIASGWVDIMTLGAPEDAIRCMRKTDEYETVGGIPFTRYVRGDGASPTDPSLVELWWNEAQYLPLRIVRTVEGGTWTQELVQIEMHGNDDILGEPAVRFPDYAAMDRADWADRVSVVREETASATAAQPHSSHTHHH